jgi:hypothetical protein
MDRKPDTPDITPTVAAMIDQDDEYYPPFIEETESEWEDE